jgi:IS1 family transposase
MNRLTSQRRAQIVSALVEGNSVRATCRMLDVDKGTVLKLLVDIGDACAAYQDQALRGLTCKRIQCDEIWSFCYSKQKNVPLDKRGEYGYGDVWTWVAIDADTKLVPSYLVGARDLGGAMQFMHDLAGRLANRIQLTTDGWPPYVAAVKSAFGNNVDYATLTKQYGNDPAEPDTRYSPPVCTSITVKTQNGDPDPDAISTSYIERQNLTMRMSMRRFTRLTNAFSKKVENLTAAVSLHFAFYNLCRPHAALGRGVTPAMAAGVTDHLWSLDELIGLLEVAESTPTRRGRYTKTRARDSD